MNELIFRAQNGEKGAMDDLVNENVGLIWSIVRRFVSDWKYRFY